MAVLSALLAVTFAILAYSAEGSSKVQVELYSEALCPFCARFLVNNLKNFFGNGLIDIVDLRLIPYGNARINPTTGTITCQHGPDECELNIIQACAIKLFPDVYDWFPFIYCVESLPSATAVNSWKSCDYAVANITLVEECYKGPFGIKLEKEFAQVTNELDPPHQYVPWVLVNKQPLYEDYGNVEKYVCAAYKGDKKPDICLSFEANSPLLVVNDIKDRVCIN